MESAVPAVVALTDERWFTHFRPQDELTAVDEVNFWRPAAQTGFRALRPGQPFFFRLKAPYRAIAGFGFFAVSSQVSVPLAWEIFGDRNGDASKAAFEQRIGGYRTRFRRAEDAR